MLFHLCEHAGTARLDGIDLSLGVGHALEACGKLGAVEVEAVARLNGAKGRTGCAANTAGEVARLVQWAVLLCLLAVAGERLGKRVGGGRWVGLRSVVDVYVCLLAAGSYAFIQQPSHTAGSGALSKEADQRLTTSLENLGCVHCAGTR